MIGLNPIFHKFRLIGFYHPCVTQNKKTKGDDYITPLRYDCVWSLPLMLVLNTQRRLPSDGLY
jgi:hypothetical protein